MKNSKLGGMVVLVFLLFCIGINLNYLYGAAKKFEVSVEKANIHLKPDKQSSVIETLEKGAVLTCDTPRKFRRCWNYVYFKSKKSGQTKSGYINDENIKKLFKNKVVDIHREKK